MFCKQQQGGLTMGEAKRLIYRPNEVAQMLGIGKSTFWLYVSQGKIKTQKLSDRVTIVTAKEVDRFLAESVGGAE